MTHKLLAIDLDGTLLGPDHVVSPDTVEAMRAAQQAGIRVCLATGRSYVETIDFWRQLGLRSPFEPLVLIGGALVSGPDTGRTLCQRYIVRGLACEYADALCETGHSALAIVDAWRWGMDYYVAESDDAEAIHRTWFDQMNVNVRCVRRLSDVDDLPNPLRINAVVDGVDRAESLCRNMQDRFGDRLNIHKIFVPNYDVWIVEAFSTLADKWASVRYVAQAHRIGSGQIAVVGDDVNDLPMIRGAGLGAAMPQAPPEIKSAADHVVETTLAAFVHDLIAGRFSQRRAV